MSLAVDKLHSFRVEHLKGALLISPTGENFYIRDGRFNSNENEVSLLLDNGNNVEWSSIEGWSIRLENHRKMIYKPIPYLVKKDGSKDLKDIGVITERVKKKK